MKGKILSKTPFKPVIATPEELTNQIDVVVSQIKEARLQRGIPWQKVCKDLGISQSTLVKDEKPGKNISLKKLLIYSNYYNLSFTI